MRKQSRKTQKRPIGGLRRKPPKITLEEAFSYFYELKGLEPSALNLKRGILAVAFLLTWLSDMGNQSVDGNAVNALAYILKYCAAEIQP